MKNGIVALLLSILLFLIGYSELMATEQFYNSILINSASSKVQSNAESLISFGKIDNDFIELKGINQGNDGFIEFNIQHTNNVDVFLFPANNLSNWYGFKFNTNNKFVIYSAGQPIVSVPNLNDYYSFQDKFRVELCQDVLSYYKNDELIFTECISVTQAFYHRTFVHNADGTNLYLRFENNLSSCSNGLVSGETTPSSLSSSASLETKFLPNSIVLASVYSSEGDFVKQLRIRTNNKGEIPENRTLQQFKESNYIIKLNAK